jgi:hypothetical protein
MNTCDLKIISMRKDCARISTIREYISTYTNESFLDEAIQLAHVLSVLDEANLAVSRKEVRTAFNKFYKKENQGEKVGYLNWYYRTFHIKEGTKTQPSQIRQNSQKTSIVGISSQIGRDASNNTTKEPIYPTKITDNHIEKIQQTQLGGTL